MILPRVCIFVVLTVLLQSISTTTAQDPQAYSGSVRIPANWDSWYVCSDSDTNYTSYSLRVTKDTTVTPNFGTIAPGSDGQSDLSPGVVTYQLASSDLKAYLSPDPNAKFSYVSSMSCYVKPVTKCDQDTGGVLLPEDTIQCIVVTNPTTSAVYIRIAYSWSVSVFGSQNFTSPNTPGGNASGNASSGNAGGNSSGVSTNTTGNDTSALTSTPMPTAHSGGAVGLRLDRLFTAGAVIVGLLAFGVGI